MGGRGAVAPPNENVGGSAPPPPPHVSVPKISLAQHKIGLANIQSHDLFTHRFIRVALGEIICCRTFLNNSGLCLRSQSTAGFFH